MQQFFVGIVEDRQDPLLMGRCRVRVIGIHTESLIDLPTENLPWAMPMTPITSAAVSGIGQAPVGPVEGTNVVVFFKDDAFQYPVMIGTIPGFNIKADDEAEYQTKISNIADLQPLVNDFGADNLTGFKDPNGKYPRFYDEQDSNRLARKQSIANTIVQRKLDRRTVGIPVANSGLSWEQSPTGYNTTYPYNHVYESESGHVMEFDDTPGCERVNLHHRTGTFIEIDNNGSQVNRIVGNGYEIIDNDGYVQIKGNCVITVGGDAAIKVAGDTHVDTAGTVNVKAGKDVNVDSAASISLKASAAINMEAADVNIKASSFSVSADNVHMKYSLFGGDGKTFFNSGKAKPKTPEMKWTEFSKPLRQFYVPSLEDETVVEMEDFSNDQKIAALKAQGFTDDNPTIQELQKAPEVKEEIKETDIPLSKEPVNPVGCEDIKLPITNSMQLSPSFKLIDLMKASAKGSVVAQGSMTAEQIVCNLKWVANNVCEPIRKKYGGAFIISSGYRRGSGKSQHDRGQAIDMQFSDCKTREQYMARCKELIALLPAIDQIIFEQAGGKTWIHISSMKEGNRKKITSYNGRSYTSGLTLYS